MTPRSTFPPDEMADPAWPEILTVRFKPSTVEGRVKYTVGKAKACNLKFVRADANRRQYLRPMGEGC